MVVHCFLQWQRAACIYDGIVSRNIGDNARTINEQGVTIVPLDVRVLDNGEVFIRAKDPAYATPGPDEAQQFGL